jgi:uncharacterized protein (DUF983 family)
MSRPINIDKTPQGVNHADLERFGDESDYRSKCPVCKEGILLVERDPVEGHLKAKDLCRTCGQRFIYIDIEQMRAELG